MNRDLALAELYYGTAEPVPETRRLGVGRWSVLLVDGALRDIRCDGLEVIRSIAFLVRDRDWGTCAPRIEDLEVIESADAVELRYRATCSNPDDQRIDYRIEFCIDARGGVTCEAQCMASTDFLTARCGFCVLHPIDGVAGAPAIIEHGEGGIERGPFPLMIDPWQPFKDIRVVEHRLTDGQWLRCEFDGDTFEMEDQRNWSDASFKTYSRPLALPWPFVLEAGHAFSQAVRVSVRDDDTSNGNGKSNGGPEGEHASAPASSYADAPAPVVVSVPRTVLTSEATKGPLPSSEQDGERAKAAVVELHNGRRMFPELGLLIAPDELDEIVRHIGVLRATAPQRVSLHYDPLAGHGIGVLTRYADLMRQIDARATLEYALPGVDAPEVEIAVLARDIEQSGLVLSGLMISPSVHRQSNPPGSVSPPCPPLDEVYASARRLFPHLRLSGGMLSYFTEFNRKRPPVSMVDEVVHATCPIVHAADDTSVMQTLEAVAHITRSCRALIGDQPYSIGPVSLGMRQNPYGSRTMPNPDRQRIAMAGDDPRQRGLFGAAWLVGYLAAVADADLASLTLGGMTGPRGFIDARGRPYPIASVITTFGSLGGHARIDCISNCPGEIAAFAGHRSTGERVVVVANLTSRAQAFRFASAGAITGHEAARISIVDASTLADYQGGVLTMAHERLDDRERLLKPFACLIASY